MWRCQPRTLVWVLRRPLSSRLWASPPRSPGDPLKSWWVWEQYKVNRFYCIYQRMIKYLLKGTDLLFAKVNSFLSPSIPRVMSIWSRLVTRLVPVRPHCWTCWTSHPSPMDSSSNKCMTMAVSTVLRCLTSQRHLCMPSSWRWENVFQWNKLMVLLGFAWM